MLYRSGEPGDVAAMARIRVDEWGEPHYWEHRIAGYLAGRLNPGHALAPRACFVAVDESMVIGFAAGHLTTRYGCDGELQWIHVIPEARKAGVGSELLRWIARWFVEHEARRICVDVEPSNAVARAFYMRHGATGLNKHWMVWADIAVVLG